MENNVLHDIMLTPLLDTLRLEKISDAMYFSEKFSGYISNSRLGYLHPKQDGSPEKFFAGLQSPGYAPALELGSAVHELVLQPESFELAEDLGKPTAKLGAMADALYPTFLSKMITKEDVVKASDKVDYYKGKITNDLTKNVIAQCTPYWESRQQMELQLNDNKEKIFLDPKGRETVISCVSSLQSNKQIMDLLHPKGIVEDPKSENEQAILLDVRADLPNKKSIILHLKSKLDNYTIDTESNSIVLNDIKTIGKILSEFDNNIVKYHYHREMGMYMFLLRLCAEKFYGLQNPKFSANYLVVSTIPNFYSKVRPVDIKEILAGFREFRILLRYVAYLIGYKGYSLGERVGKFQL